MFVRIRSWYCGYRWAREMFVDGWKVATILGQIRSNTLFNRGARFYLWVNFGIKY